VKIVQLTTDDREPARDYSNPTPCFGAAPTALLQGFAGMSDLEIHVISCTQRPMKSPEKLADNIWFHSLVVPKIGWLRTGYQGCIRAVRGKLKEIRPDIVHGQGTERDCALEAAFSGFPNVVTLHGIMKEQARLIKAQPGTFYWLATQLERLTLPRTKGVFCNSAYTQSVVQKRARQTWRVPNAVRLEFFETPLPVVSKTSKPVLVNVGAISPRKRQLALLDLAEDLQRQDHSFELQFIGAADSHDKYAIEFSRRVKAAEHSGSVRYLGTKTLPQLINYFDAASAVIHVPSEEAFGLVVAEALARNLKLFATNVGGVPDIAQKVEGAELFPLEDSSGMTEAISRWLRAECARPYSPASEMRSRYNPLAIAMRHVEIYREVLAAGYRD
jgi:glycosyltransferase involved in cell wall biosynthesis